MKINSDFYEGFHKNTKPQQKIISKKNFTYKRIIEILDKFLLPKGTILDIGCGAGTIDFYLAKNNHKVTGIDISQKSISACNQTNEILRLKSAPVFKVIDFPNHKLSGEYDSIICLEVIEHVAEDKKALKIIFELLNSDGILILSTPSKNAPLHKIGYSKNFDTRVGHLRRYSSEELDHLLENSGFIVLKTIKLEGVVRNFLFLNKFAGKLIRILNKIEFFSTIVTFLDDLSLFLFGESDLLVVARKKTK